MQMAVDVAGFTAAEADQLRQAMGAKRSSERMERLRGRLYQGMAERGITGDIADRIYEKLAAFGQLRLPESRSVSFAYLVYASAWLKLHYPAAFLAALLNAQPMGFWSPNTLVADARRHGVTVRGPDVNLSAATATLEREEGREAGAGGAARDRICAVAGEELAERGMAGRAGRPDGRSGAADRDGGGGGGGAGYTRGVRGCWGWSGGRCCGRPGPSPRPSRPAARDGGGGGAPAAR